EPGLFAISGQPPATATGVVTFTLRLSGVAGSTDETFTLRVVPGNRAPVVTESLPAQVGFGQTYHGSIRAADPDGDPVRFAKFDGPTALSVAADGSITWTPAAGDVGPVPHSVTVLVTDDRGHDLVLTFPVTVTAGVQTDRLPVVTSLAPVSAVVGEELAFVPSAADPDGDPLTWS